MGALGEHLHVGLVVGINLAALENLQANGAILVVGKEWAATRLAYILNYTAHTHGAIELATQISGIYLIILGIGTQVVGYKLGNLLQLGLAGTCIENLEVLEGLLLKGYQYARQYLLPLYSLGLQTVGYYVVDILNEDHIGLDLVEILDEGTVTAWTEQQRAILVAEWGVIGVSGYGIG